MAKGRMTTPPLRLGARAATYRPGFKSDSKAHESWKWEFYILPNPEANEAIAEYLVKLNIVEEHVRCLALPGYAEKQFVYAVRKDVMDKVSANRNLRNAYKAFVRYEEGGKIYRYRTEEQITAAKNRKAKKDQKRTRMTVVKTS